MDIRLLEARHLIKEAELNIMEADRMVKAYGDYKGPSAQLLASLAMAQSLYAGAQSYIALATFKQQERHA